MDDFYPFVENGPQRGASTQDTPAGGEGSSGQRTPGTTADDLGTPVYPARIAVYDDMEMSPRVVIVEPKDIRDYLAEITSTTYELVTQQGGTFAFSMIRELVENYIHAAFIEPTISILDRGQTIVFSDQGPGIPNKRDAMRPSFTSATRAMKKYIRGVGSGLPIVEEYIKRNNGTLTIEDNLGHGTIVTVSLVPRGVATGTPAPGQGSGESPVAPGASGLPNGSGANPPAMGTVPEMSPALAGSGMVPAATGATPQASLYGAYGAGSQQGHPVMAGAGMPGNQGYPGAAQPAYPGGYPGYGMPSQTATGWPQGASPSGSAYPYGAPMQGQSGGGATPGYDGSGLPLGSAQVPAGSTYPLGFPGQASPGAYPAGAYPLAGYPVSTYPAGAVTPTGYAPGTAGQMVAGAYPAYSAGMSPAGLGAVPGYDPRALPGTGVGVSGTPGAAMPGAAGIAGEPTADSTLSSQAGTQGAPGALAISLGLDEKLLAILGLFSRYTEIGPKEINDAFGTPNATGTRRLKKLETAGTVIKRGQKYQLTDVGHQIISQMAPHEDEDR